MKTLTPILLALALVATHPAEAAPPQPDARDVLTLLSGYEKVPTAADWARLGTPAEVANLLVAVAADAGRGVVVRARALSSLGHFPSPVVRTFLDARVRDRTWPATLRGKAAIALAGAFGDAAGPTVATLLAERDVDLREDGIRAFGRMTGPAAERFVVGRAAVEPVERLAERLRQAGQGIARARAVLKSDRRFDPSLDTLPDIPDPGPVAR